MRGNAGGSRSNKNVLGCRFKAFPAKVLRDPFSIAEVLMSWTRKSNAIDKVDLPPEQVLQVDDVFPTRARTCCVSAEKMF